MTVSQDSELIAARREIGLYSIQELREMFPKKNGKPMSRNSIDIAMNSGKLRYISPNNRDRYIYLKDFLEFMEFGESKEKRMEFVIPFPYTNSVADVPQTLPTTVED